MNVVKGLIKQVVKKIMKKGKPVPTACPGRKNGYFDMDGSLADFYAVTNWQDKMYQRWFFLTLRPLLNMVNGVNLFLERHPEMEDSSFINSAVLEENKFAAPEKTAWTKSAVPKIPKDNYLYVTVGNKKSTAVKRKLTKDDVLFDDNSKNLLDWENDGGTSIKIINGINGKGEKFKGPRIDASWSAERICSELEKILLN